MNLKHWTNELLAKNEFNSFNNRLTIWQSWLFCIPLYCICSWVYNSKNYWFYDSKKSKANNKSSNAEPIGTLQLLNKFIADGLNIALITWFFVVSFFIIILNLLFNFFLLFNYLLSKLCYLKTLWWLETSVYTSNKTHLEM